VAGIGNVFMGDDGFGVAVATTLAGRPLPDGVDVVDFGIRGMDLAYALGDGYDAAVLVDVAPRGQPPGTLAVIEPELEADERVGFAAHRMDPVAVLALAQRLEALPRRVLIVACEPQTMLDPDRGELLDALSAPVARAVEQAAALIEELLPELAGGPLNHDEGAMR
jgi:hydrogenase maturation protease